MYTLKQVSLSQEFLSDSHKIFLSCEREILIFKILYHFSHWTRDWNWDNGLQPERKTWGQWFSGSSWKTLVWTFKFVLQIFSIIQRVLWFPLTKFCWFFFFLLLQKKNVSMQALYCQIYTLRKFWVVEELESGIWKHCVSRNALI